MSRNLSIKLFVLICTSLFSLLFSLFPQTSLAEFTRPYVEANENQLITNSVVINNPPSWLSQGRVQSVVDNIERKLEWSTHRVTATFYASRTELIRNFSGRAAAEIMAFTKKTDNTIHLGPKVTRANFDLVFGHELAHVIIFQKYKLAIPAWLNEGLCNSVAGYKEVKFKWLSRQKPRIDVSTLHHPYEINNMERADVHYAASLAAIKMLEKKCPDFKELLNLSLNSNIDNYIKTYCQIPDVNKTFWSWIDEQAKYKY